MTIDDKKAIELSNALSDALTAFVEANPQFSLHDIISCACGWTAGLTMCVFHWSPEKLSTEMLSLASQIIKAAAVLKPVKE